MRIINFKIKDRTITQINEDKLIGMVGQDKFHVNFVDDEWQGLHKTLKLIRNDGTVLYFALVNDEVELTPDCYIEGIAQIGFFGTKNENEPETMKIASTNYTNLYFYPHAYDGGETPSNLPTPTQWDNIIGEMNEVVDEMNDAIDDMNEIKSDVAELKQDTQQIKDDTLQIKNEVQTMQEDVTSKVNAFNTNYTEKLELFNSNAVSKTNTFNNNATQKTNDFNSNATDKTTDFNSNASSKTTTFNSNATSKTNTFNTNATNKTTAFNNNYTEKVGEVNGIITDFKAYVETVDYNYNNLQNKPQTWNALLGIVE